MVRVDGSHEVRFCGIGISPGAALGRAATVEATPNGKIALASVPWVQGELERTRILQAIERAERRLEQLGEDVARRIGKAESLIFKVQQTILGDRALIRDILAVIEDTQAPAEQAVSQVLDLYEMRISQIDDEYIRERGSDIAEVRDRLLAELDLPSAAQFRRADEERSAEARVQIIVAEELTPSMAVEVDPAQVAGFVTERGGRTSHAAILARAIGIPAVTGVKDICSHVSAGTEILLDGDTGKVTLWPNDCTLARYHRAEVKAAHASVPAEPVPGLTVMANINLSADTAAAIHVQAEGIGLYRTEFEWFAAGRHLDEQEQYERYRSVLDAMGDQPVVFRLLDVGGDKGAEFFDIPEQDNPYLGFRGSRLLLSRPDLLGPQVRALARASRHGPVDILYPMITELEQFERLRRMVLEKIEDIPAGRIRHGVMFEVPSACLQANELLAAADFGSIGTNDLVQYLFAVDRNNELVAADYSPDKPVFWRLIEQVVAAARRTGRSLSVCGEMASRPPYLKRLIKLGVRTVSASPRLIPDLRRSVRDSLPVTTAAEGR